jgi:hypothetical protein
MSDIRSQARKVIAKNVDTLRFEVKRNNITSGFSVKLSWNYDVRQYPGVVGFRIYKATMSQPKLRKDYVITQKALEKTSAVKSFSTQSNILYNKSLFSQNSKVKFATSNSTQHDKAEGSLSNYNYVSLNIIRPDFMKTDYSFDDRNIKFGETYSYYITALTSDFRETTPVPVFVNVESLLHPLPPSVFQVSENDRGILLIVGNNQDRNIAKFKVFKREDSEKNFELLADLENNSEMVYFVDLDIFPKKHYVYRVYSEDIFGTLSLYGEERIASFKYVPYTTNIEYQPSIQIDGDSINGIRIRIRNERPDKVSSVRIERKDNWKFDTMFEVKSYNAVPWPNNHLFENGVIDFTDKTVSANRAYTYRITSFNKVGSPVSYFMTPPMAPGDVHGVLNNQSPVSEKPRIASFDMDVVSGRQNPVFVKCSWSINGDWSYLLLNNGEKKIKIDNLHKSVFLGDFSAGKRYNITIEVYDLDNKKADEYRNIILSI